MIENSEVLELCDVYREMDEHGKKTIRETAAQLLVAQKTLEQDERVSENSEQ